MLQWVFKEVDGYYFVLDPKSTYRTPFSELHGISYFDSKVGPVTRQVNNLLRVTNH